MILLGFSTNYCSQYRICMYVWMCRWVWVFQCVCIVFENVYQRYMYSNTHFPSGKTYLCIYSIYIVSVSFAYNMQTATWWSDSTEVHLKDGAGGKDTCAWEGLSLIAAPIYPCDWLDDVSKKRNTEVRFYDTFHHVDTDPIFTARNTLSLPCYAWVSQCQGQIKLNISHLGHCSNM